MEDATKRAKPSRLSSDDTIADPQGRYRHDCAGDHVNEIVRVKQRRRREHESVRPLLGENVLIVAPGNSLRAIDAQLKQMRERTPRGNPKWSAPSVKRLLNQAARWRNAQGVDLRVPGLPLLQSCPGDGVRS